MVVPNTPKIPEPIMPPLEPELILDPPFAIVYNSSIHFVEIMINKIHKCYHEVNITFILAK